MVTSPIPTPAPPRRTIAHAHSLSRSPGTDNDDVFSNPDTDDARSDLTGATSPGPNSPDPGSPTRRTALPTSPLAATATAATATAATADSSATTLTKRAPGGSSSRHPAHSSPLSTSPTSRTLTLLPSAHGLPTDPREASTLAQLFPSGPLASATAETHSVLLSSGLNSPDEERAAFFPPRWSRPTTRPSSPDYVAALPGSRRPSLHPALAAAAEAVPAATTDSPQIFERDIEHRDAAHLLSHQEVMDVAIPSVLDDAAEAIVEGDEAELEIVAPHVTAPLPLSARALALADASSTSTSTAQSPASPALAHSGLMEAPPGSIAAQLAEKLGGASVSRAHHDDGARFAGASSGAAYGHRRPHSDASSASSFRSRSPGDRPGPGVQQVLDASPTRGYGGGGPGSHSPVSRVGRSSSPTGNLFASTVFDTAGAGTSSLHASLHSHASPASPLPSLPMPNPYRNASPSPAPPALPFASTPAPLLPSHAGLPLPEDRPVASSLSIDGAVISRSDVATRGGSLAGIADALVSDPSHAGAAPQSSTEASPYLARTAPPETDNNEPPMPGAFASDAAGVKDKRRLSFFSYADIINQTPADLLDFDGAVASSAGAGAGMGRSASSGGGVPTSPLGPGRASVSGTASPSPLGRAAARRGSSGVHAHGELEKESLGHRLEKLQIKGSGKGARTDVFGPAEGDNW